MTKRQRRAVPEVTDIVLPDIAPGRKPPPITEANKGWMQPGEDSRRAKGRPVGSYTRARATIRMLDKVYQENSDVLAIALQRLFRERPLEFMDKYIMPFVPKEAVVTGVAGGIVQIQVNMPEPPQITGVEQVQDGPVDVIDAAVIESDETEELEGPKVVDL